MLADDTFGLTWMVEAPSEIRSPDERILYGNAVEV